MLLGLDLCTLRCCPVRTFPGLLVSDIQGYSPLLLDTPEFPSLYIQPMWYEDLGAVFDLL